MRPETLAAIRTAASTRAGVRADLIPDSYSLAREIEATALPCEIASRTGACGRAAVWTAAVTCDHTPGPESGPAVCDLHALHLGAGTLHCRHADDRLPMAQAGPLTPMRGTR